MKKLITATALAALIAVPSIAQAAKAKKRPPAQNRSVIMARPVAVFLGNQYVGADPDANIRLELARDTGAFDGGGD
jgi:hypothetical protein